MRRLNMLAWGWLCLVFVFSGMHVVAQETTTLTILDVVYQDQFPEMAVKLRYLDAQQNLIQGFADFEVAVGNKAVTTPVGVTKESGPMAVAIVADLSAGMRAKGTPLKPDRFADMHSLLQEQVLALQLPDRAASLVVFTDTVSLYFPMSTDIGGLRNIINGSVEGRPFAPPTEEASSTAYPLEEAIVTALEQLEQVPPDMPRALFVFAAGVPDLSLDLDRIQTVVAAAASAEHPLNVTVVALGSNEADDTPANPGVLEQLATATDGTFFHYFAGNDVAATTARQTEIKTHFEQVFQLADYYILRFEADTALVGSQEVQVTAGNASDSFPIDIAAVPPRVQVVVDSRDFQGRVRMEVKPEFVQGSLTHVEYLLGNHRIGEADEGPAFVYEIDAYSDMFQQQFAPGDYELVAAVRDSQGKENRSDPLVVKVVQRPPPASLMEQLQVGVTRFGGIILMALVGVLAVAGGGIYLMRRSHSHVRPTPSRRFSTAQQPTGKHSRPMNADDEPTGEVDHDLTAEFSSDQDELTQMHDDERTLRFSGSSTIVYRQFRLVVEQGLSDDAQKVFHLGGNGSSHYFIGRPTSDGVRQPDIALPNKNVSRMQHAKLVLLANGGIELIALESGNGTFVGDGSARQRLLPNTSQVLKHGDVFWISPAVKLRLEEE